MHQAFLRIVRAFWHRSSCGFVIAIAATAIGSHAVEIKLAREVDQPPHGQFKHYKITPEGATDDHFSFTAIRMRSNDASEDFWYLKLMLRDRGAVSSADYLKTVNACIDRLRIEFPNANVQSIALSVADDSNIWTEVKSYLTPVLRDLPSPPQMFPQAANDAVEKCARASTTVRQLAGQLASRLGEEPKDISLLGDGELALDPKRSVSSWHELLQLPRLGIWVDTLRINLSFEKHKTP